VRKASRRRIRQAKLFSETDAYSKLAAPWLQKSPNSNSGEKREKIARHFKGLFQWKMCEFDPSQVSQAVPESEKLAAI
jgi:hypothetical protein